MGGVIKRFSGSLIGQEGGNVPLKMWNDFAPRSEEGSGWRDHVKMSKVAPDYCNDCQSLNLGEEEFRYSGSGMVCGQSNLSYQHQTTENDRHGLCQITVSDLKRAATRVHDAAPNIADFLHTVVVSHSSSFCHKIPRAIVRVPFLKPQGPMHAVRVWDCTYAVEASGKN